MKTKVDKNGDMHVYMTDNEYDDYWNLAEEINNNTISNGVNLHAIFMEKSKFPTIEEMEKHKIKQSLIKWLPYLFFYEHIQINSISPDYKKSKKYIHDIFMKYVHIE